MLSVIFLDEMHLCEVSAAHSVPMKASTDGRSEKFAIAIAQCSGRSPLEIEYSFHCHRYSSAFSDMFWNGTSFQQTLVSVEEELRTETPGTSEGTIWNSIRARSRIFLQSNKFVKRGLINGPADVVMSFLNKFLGFPQIGDPSGLRHVLGK